MARTKKAESTAAEAAQRAQEQSQDVREQRDVSQDIQGQETGQEAAETPQGASSAPTAQEVIGPENPEDLLGCQDEDEDEAELEETEFIEYAVAGCGRLNLRESPSLAAPIVAALPCGVGVLGNTRPAEEGWRQVFTGRLFGWVMDKYLEPLELPGQDDGAD